MFTVYYDNKPAIGKSETWSNNKFDTFEEALNYAKSWVGTDGPALHILNIILIGIFILIFTILSVKYLDGDFSKKKKY